MIYVIYFLLICGAIWFVSKFANKFKVPSIGSLAVFTGGLKKGKSAVSLAVALRRYRSNLKAWKWSCRFTWFFNLFRKNKLDYPLKPLFYSNIPLTVEYVSLTRDVLLMEKRVVPRSVVFIDEASLVADSMLYKDQKLNYQLLRFFKLFGHISLGGSCVVNTHSITDLHMSLKRVTSEFYYINKTVKLPLISFTEMREERYSEDTTSINSYNEDIELSMRKCFFLSRVFKYYDCYTYSELVAYKDYSYMSFPADKKRSLKSYDIPSFNPAFSSLFDEVNKIKMESIKNEKME